MGLKNDPNQDRRSIMMRKPCVCSGAYNGVQCAKYWALDQKFAANNSDTLRRGDLRRGCSHVDGFFLEFTDVEVPTYCNHYEPRKEPGLVALVKRAVALAVGLAPREGRVGVDTEKSKTVSWGFTPFDAYFEDFRPVTLEEIEKLREEFPDKPTGEIFVDPLSLTLKDLINGPQKGIIQRLSPEEVAKGRVKRDPVSGQLVQYSEDGYPTGFPDPSHYPELMKDAPVEKALDGLWDDKNPKEEKNDGE